MAKWIRIVAATMGLGALAVASQAAMLEQVNLDGSAGHSTFQSAITAVDDGGVVEIIEAGTYLGPVVIPGGKTFTIRATVPGVVSQNNPASAHWLIPRNAGESVLYVAGKVNVTLEDFTIRRADGTGAVWDMDQRPKGPLPGDADDETVTVTLMDMVVEHTEAAAGGEAIRIDDGPADNLGDGALLTFSATNTTLSTLQTSGSAKPALRVNGDGITAGFDRLDNLTVNLTNCTLSNAGAVGMIRTDARNNQTWNLTNVTMTTTGTGNRGFEINPSAVAADHQFCVFNFNNVSITSPATCIFASRTNSNNIYILTDCTLNSATRDGFEFSQPFTNNSYTITNSTFNVQRDGFGMATAATHSDSDFTFTGSTLNCGRNAILVNPTTPGQNNTWVLRRSTFNNSAAASAGRTVDIRYARGASPGAPLPAINNSIQMYNCLVLSQQGTANTARGFNTQDTINTLYHNTFIAAGTGGERAMGNTNSAGWDTTVDPTYVACSIQAKNNLMLNYEDAGQVDPLLRQVMSGSYVGSNNNIIVGPTDDDSKGALGSWVNTPAGLAGCITAAGINATTYVPEAGSVTLGASDPDSAILTAIASVDRLGVARPGPTGSVSDVGAFENATLPVVISTIPGDVNDDGFVDVADVTELGNYINAIVGLPAGDADVDNIGGVGDAADLTYLVNYLVGNGAAPPAP